MVSLIMSEIEKFFKEIDVKLTEEELIDLFKQDISEEEVKEAREYLKSLGFDLKSFCTEGNQWIGKLFNKRGHVFPEKVREAAVKIQSTFSAKGSFHNIIKLLYALGFSMRNIIFTIYRLGFKGISESIVRNHIIYNKYEFDRERLKFMELVDCAKATVFQELQAEIKSAEKRSAELYLDAIKKLQDALEDIDPIIESTKWNRITGQINKLQEKLNSMHGVEELRSATIQTAAKISLLKAAKEIEDGPKNLGDSPTGKMIEANGEVVSPFREDGDNKIIAVPPQQLCS